MNKIEAVTVCVDYADWFSGCVSNKSKLSNWVVVTHERDHDTIELCIQNDIKYTLTDRLYDDGAFFAKGKAINDGLKELDLDGWILQLDADVLLPQDFHNVITNADLDIECIYGASREHAGVKRTEINPDTGEEHMRPLIGFFQMWHSSKWKQYPEDSMHAGDDDEMMSLRYKYPEQWKYLDLTVHDVSGEFCQHWWGRKLHKRANAFK